MEKSGQLLVYIARIKHAIISGDMTFRTDLEANTSSHSDVWVIPEPSSRHVQAQLFFIYLLLAIRIVTIYFIS
jgi:hypothetical protein